jgi:hypothetical protein
MRFGHWRGVTLACAVVAAIVASGVSARADAFHVIPKETPALDYRTGDVMYAPPIPYGCYTKDYCGAALGCVAKVVGCPGRLCRKLCGHCGGAGCGHCGNRGSACGDPGCGACGGQGDMCGNCGGAGCGMCGMGRGRGHGLFHGRGAGGLCGRGIGRGGLCGGGLCSGPAVLPSKQQPIAVQPSAQVLGSPQSMICGGCGGRGRGCGLCGGKGFLHRGGIGACGNCGGAGCGMCGGGRGLFGHGGRGACGNCGGAGCGMCGGGQACNACGGAGCRLCGGTGLCSKLLGLPHAAIAKVFHIGQVKYFVGAGGPVPLTPGYVNYVVPTRSPRDYFAFPPFVDTDP